MPFKVIQRYNTPKRVPAAPVSIAKCGKECRVRISNDIAAQLGWSAGQRLAIAVGTGSDTGWIAFYPDDNGFKLGINGDSKHSLQISTTQILKAAPAMAATGTEHVIQEGVLYVATPAVAAKPKSNGAHKAPTLSMVAAE